MNQTTKYPITIGPVDGNGFIIMAAARAAIRDHLRFMGEPQTVVESVLAEYSTAAKSGDYDNLIRVTLEYVDIRAVEADDDEGLD